MDCSNKDEYKHCWSKIQAVVGVVPASLQRTLELQGYAASAGLGDITNNDIQEMEAAMKKCAAHHTKLLDVNLFSELYGLFTANPGFLPSSEPSHIAVPPSLEPRPVSSITHESAVKNVMGRLMAYYTQRITDSSAHQEFLAALKTMPIHVVLDKGGSLVATITSVLCSPVKPLRIVRSGSGTWLTGHCSGCSHPLGAGSQLTDQDDASVERSLSKLENNLKNKTG